jgi:GEVED domain/Fibronectin type III domain/Secretion system C-terminal sorting domain
MKKHFMLCCLLALTSATLVAQNCGVPVNLNAVYTIQNGTLQFTWDPVPNVIEYQINITEASLGWGDGYTFPTTSNSFTFPEPVEAEGFTLHWRVVSVCSTDTDTSAVAILPVACAVPSAASTTNITTTSATFNWVNPWSNITTNYYDIGYRRIGSSSWISLPYNNNGSNTYTINNLLPNTAYEWCVNRDCVNGVSAPVITTFTTLPPPCNPPATLNILNLTNTSARLNWSGGGNAQSFIVQYRQVGAPNWITITIPNSNTQYQLNGLTLNTTYEYRVATNCGASTSVYSAPFTFTTNCVSLNNTSAWISYFRIGSLIRTSGADPNGYIFWNALTNITRGATFTLSVRASFNGGVVAQNFAAYLDGNQNGIFELSEQVAGVATINSSSTQSYSIVIPTTTQLGATRLRIVMLRRNQPGVNTGPCVPVGSFGEMEDYVLNIVTAAQGGSEQRSSNASAETVENNLSQKPIHIYPNPSRGAFVIQSETALTKYSVYNAAGVWVMAEEFVKGANTATIPEGVLSPGLYMVVVTDRDGHTHCRKIVATE